MLVWKVAVCCYSYGDMVKVFCRQLLLLQVCDVGRYNVMMNVAEI
jgi:hypothetical protein